MTSTPSYLRLIRRINAVDRSTDFLCINSSLLIGDGIDAKQEDQPGRSEAIRRLVEIGLKARAK